MWSSSPVELYERVNHPVLLLSADSPGAPSAWSDAKRAGVSHAASALPRAAVRWFSPADHDVHAQHPVEVAAAMMQWAADAGLTTS
jgi:pimeloyl-ACP methyl ester carboxylesterase